MKRRDTRWAIFAAFLAIVALLGLAGCDLDDLVAGLQSSAAKSEEIVETTFPVDGSPVLHIDSSNGAVSVRGVEGQTEVRVTATLVSGGKTLEEAEDRRERIVVRMTQTGNEITLAYRQSEQDDDVKRYSGVQFDVTTPIDVEVDIDTSNGAIDLNGLTGLFQVETSNGAIDADSLTGDLDAETSNGRISVYRSVGTFDLHTSNGEIRLEDVEGTIEADTSNGQILFHGLPVGDRHELRTSNGRIEVAIPSDCSVAIDAETSNSSISTDLPLVGDTQGDEWSATLNGPATVLMVLRTSNGNIRIESLP